MKVEFYKYQGTGNDFILIDNRDLFFPKADTQLIARLCHRRYGVGADGLILLENKKGFDFNMVYFNSDGKSSSMCGNGGRCITAFADKIGIKKDEYHFNAADGVHKAVIKISENPDEITVKLQMKNVDEVEIHKDHFLLNTGSPHYIRFLKNLKNYNVPEQARLIRYSPEFEENGINVNFVEIIDNSIFIRTYERGVEDETLSCGTGMTAAAICASIKGFCIDSCTIHSMGGKTSVFFKREKGNQFHDIWLQGPACLVYKGEINI